MHEHARNPILEHLDALVGEWETEATHRLMPDAVIRGHSTFEWLEGERFLIWRASNEHPDFPASISILGCDGSDASDGSGDAGGCSMRSFDSRGYYRHYSLGAEDGAWRFWNDQPGFAQRFTGTLSADGMTISGVAELCQDGTTWMEDLWLTFTRVP